MVMLCYSRAKKRNDMHIPGTCIRIAALLVLAVLIMAGIAGAGGVTYEMSSGLVAEWHFDGNAQDSSGNGNHGNVYGAGYVDGIKGQALGFDGMDNYFSAPVSDALNSVSSQGTILAWVNFSDTYLIKETGSTCSAGSRSLTLWRFGTYSIKSTAGIDCSARLQSDWRNDASQIGKSLSQSLKSGKWTLVVLTYDGKNIIQYLDGKKINLAPLSGHLNISDGKFWLGRNGNEFFHMYFHGMIDEVKIYNRALSADEVLIYYNSVIPSGTGNKEVQVLENDNILSSETRFFDLEAYKPVEYSFTSPDITIYQIIVTGKENLYDIPIKVEALKWSPESIPKIAPGKVYRNLNIISGTKNVKEALISFRVENSWIESNDIDYYDVKMYRWTGTEWGKLETVKKTKDSTHAYYEAKTYGFSTFAISAVKSPPAAAVVKSGTGASSIKLEEYYGWITPILIIFLLCGLYVFRKRLKNIRIPKIYVPALIVPRQPDKPQPSDIKVNSAFGYKGATILYKLKVENISSKPVADIKVFLFVPNVFLLLEKEKSIALLKASESKTVTFEIRPTGECGDCEVSGRVNYYDTANNMTKEVDIEGKMLSIICPMLKVKEISEPDWQNMVSNLLQTEENTREIDMSSETLFSMVSRIIKDMHMHLLTPEVTQSQQLFDGVARFYGEGVKGLKYAAQAEVVGGARKAKLILRAWAEKEDALTGFYHGILDEIEKRINVKGYIDEPIVQHFNIAGHLVTGQVGRIVDVGDRNVVPNEKEAGH